MKPAEAVKRVKAMEKDILGAFDYHIKLKEKAITPPENASHRLMDQFNIMEEHRRKMLSELSVNFLTSTTKDQVARMINKLDEENAHEMINAIQRKIQDTHETAEDSLKEINYARDSIREILAKQQEDYMADHWQRIIDRMSEPAYQLKNGLGGPLRDLTRIASEVEKTERPAPKKNLRDEWAKELGI